MSAGTGTYTLVVTHDDQAFLPIDLVHLAGPEFTIVWVVDASSLDPLIVRLLRRLGPMVDIDGRPIDEISRELTSFQPDGIISFTDGPLILAATLAEHLGLPFHTPEVAARITDKFLQRTALRHAGVEGTPYWSAPASLAPSARRELAAELPYPVVAKPTVGSGSRYVLHAADAAELLCHIEGAPDVDWLIEGFVADDPTTPSWQSDMVSVESLVRDGVATHVAVTGRFALAEPFRETGQFLPADVTDSERRALFSLADRAIAALGITHSAVHTEFKLTPDGPRLIEVNGRIGGGIPFLTDAVAGINLTRLACELAVCAPLRDGPFPIECTSVGFSRWIQPPTEAVSVTSVDGLDRVATLPGVELVSLSKSPGDTLDWRWGTSNQVVTVRGQVSDYEALSALIHSIDEVLQIAYTDDARQAAQAPLAPSAPHSPRSVQRTTSIL